MNARQWQRGEHDHGAALARDLGYAPLYFDYNSGLHISVNGRALAALVERALASWPRPVEHLVIIGHSMGGLVARSACHVAATGDCSWLQRLRALVFLGTPHHGAPLERGGNLAQGILGAVPYAKPLARLGRVRSAGITDLRHGALRDEDWSGRDRFVGSRLPAALPTPAGVPCFAMAAVLGQRDEHTKNQLLGDGIVPLASALGCHPSPERDLGIPEARRWVGYGMGHFDLLDDAQAYAQLRRWLATLR
jgi:pimeloyl-ACP methyl ester carboxylesterase